MSYLRQKTNKELAEKILQEFENISLEFSGYQTKVNLECISGCGRCCFKPDIFCTPIELLPMVLHLIETDQANEVYEKLKNSKLERCFFLQVTDSEKLKGFCESYHFRPLVCRTFGVSARNGKNGYVEFSVCKEIKTTLIDSFDKLIKNIYVNESLDLPYIDSTSSKMATIDPQFFDEPKVINESLKIMLEKMLYLESLVKLDSEFSN